MVDLHRDTIPDADYGPFDAGWDARLEGKRMSENPWAINNWKHYDWDKGWINADETDEKLPSAKQSH